MKRILIATAAAAALFGAVALAPESADAAGRWRINFTPGEMANVISGGKASYYMTYSVKNASGSARKAPIRIELRTETKKTYGDHYDAGTSRAVAKDEGKVRHSTRAIRSTELADSGAADGLASFGRIDPNADELEVRVYGLWDPIVRDKRGRTFAERRVLVLKYKRSGDEYNRPSDTITFVSRAEEVEGEPKQLHTE